MSENRKTLIDVSIRQTWHRIARMYNQKALSLDMTMSVGFILMYVEINGSPSTSLGPRMGMEPTSLSRTLKTMESQGLIRREVSVEDKRKVLIFLTSKGVEKRRMGREFLLDFNKMIDDKLSKKAKESFYETISIIDELTQNID